MTSPARRHLRLVGRRNPRMHYTRHQSELAAPPRWGLYAGLSWVFSLGWLFGAVLPHAGFPVGPVLVATGLTVVALVRWHRS